MLNNLTRPLFWRVKSERISAHTPPVTANMDLPFHDEPDIPLLPQGRRRPHERIWRGPHRDAVAAVVQQPIRINITPTGRAGHFDVYDVRIVNNNQSVEANLAELIHQLRQFFVDTYRNAAQHQVIIRFGDAETDRWSSTTRLSYDAFMAPTMLQTMEHRIEMMINSADLFDFYNWLIEFEVRNVDAGRGQQVDDDDDKDGQEDITLKDLPHLKGVKGVPSKKTGLCGYMSLVWLTATKIERHRMRNHNNRSWYNKARDLRDAMGLRERPASEGLLVDNLALYVNLHPRRRVVVFDLPVGVPSIHAVVAVHMKRENRKHREIVDAIERHGPPPAWFSWPTWGK